MVQTTDDGRVDPRTPAPTSPADPTADNRAVNAAGNPAANGGATTTQNFKGAADTASPKPEADRDDKDLKNVKEAEVVKDYNAPDAVLANVAVKHDLTVQQVQEIVDKKNKVKK